MAVEAGLRKLRSYSAYFAFPYSPKYFADSGWRLRSTSSLAYMPHPIMFDENDPLLARVRSIALTFPGAAEKISHGRPFFHTKTAFAVYGGSTKAGGAQFPRSVIVKPAPEERLALLDEAHTYLPAYLGPSGWMGYDLDRNDLDWTEVGELLDMSFRMTAPATLVRRLDASVT